MIHIIFRRLFTGLNKNDIIITLISYISWLVLCVAVFIICFKFSESVSWNESAWQAWQTFTTVGYGNAPAQTVTGRLVTVIFGTAGIAYVGVIISGVFDWRQWLSDRRRYGMKASKQKNGYIVVHYPGNDNFRMFIDELAIVEKDVQICVIDSNLEEIPEIIRAQYNNVHFVRGEALSRETYEAANISDAKSVIIFPLVPGSADSDGTTLAIYTLIRRWFDSDLRIIPILVKAKNEEIFQDKQAVATVWTGLDVLALVQECQDPYSSEVVSELLANSSGANPNTVKPVKIAGWKWSEFVIASMQVGSDAESAVNPFAVIGADNTRITCPAPDYVIKNSDLISVIAYPGFNWEKFEEKLQK